ncbi:ammonium transporter [Nitzschia inconspicua]|uniref:Ammonium transporter n=1 Tax=Nitzschia inconspicua TaxID=303405 RepID=A0A9K3LWV0_9STRA|nr:ammonium transporter [Nitzschia inconspicua]KAG7370043.1 ammonium transporter [Nitzschia inconspicua]
MASPLQSFAVYRDLLSDDPTIFESCYQQIPDGNTTAILECISNALEEKSSTPNDRFFSEDEVQFMIVLSGALIFFMQAGFAMLCAGCVQLKNVQNTMLKNLLDAGGSAMAFFLIGYSLAFGSQNSMDGTTFVGRGDYFARAPSPSYWFFEYTFSATSVTIIAGTLAERCQMLAYLLYSIILSGLIYPIVVHQIWSKNGFLSVNNLHDPFLGQGVIDFAGSGVVHLTGGVTALYATIILGPRRGRFFDEMGEPIRNPIRFRGHSVALQLLGTMILWFGWFGFNCGSALLLSIDQKGVVAAKNAVTTALSAAAGSISALFTNLVIEERKTGEYRFILLMATNGALSGLVAITSGCSVVEPWAAVIIGLIAGWNYLGSSVLLEWFKIDDAVNGIPVHMVNGMWGLIATGLLASPRLQQLTYEKSDNPGLFYSFGQGQPNATLFGCQIVAILFIAGWTTVTMLPFFLFLNYKGWLRSDSYEEIIGLDVSYHGGGMRLSMDDGAGIQFVEAHRRRRLEEAKKDHHQSEGHSQDTCKALETVDESLSCPEGVKVSEQDAMDSPPHASELHFQQQPVQTREPSSYLVGSERYMDRFTSTPYQ